MPQTPPHSRGVINLRGKVIPVVDGVAEVINLAPTDIEDTPDFGEGVAITCLLGMAKAADKVRILLDIDEVMASQELQGLAALVQ